MKFRFLLQTTSGMFLSLQKCSWYIEPFSMHGILIHEDSLGKILIFMLEILMP